VPETPAHPLLTDYRATLRRGRTYRYVVPIGGGCGAGRLWFNGRSWQVTEEWGEAPYPKDWPVRHEDVSDAPTDHLYGTVRLVDDSHIEVAIEDGPVLRTYEPAPAPRYFCG
jgi:hypothetical protein